MTDFVCRDTSQGGECCLPKYHDGSHWNGLSERSREEVVNKNESNCICHHGYDSTCPVHRKAVETVNSRSTVKHLAFQSVKLFTQSDIDALKAEIAKWKRVATHAADVADQMEPTIERLTRERDAAEAAALERVIKTAKATQFRCHAADDVDFHSGCVQTKESIIDNLGKLRSDQQSSALEQVKAEARLEEAKWWLMRKWYIASSIEAERLRLEEQDRVAELEAAAGRKS